jgi:hypothetical protein
VLLLFQICPVILPIYHVGMNRVLPNPEQEGDPQSFRIRFGNLVTICIGQSDGTTWFLTVFRIWIRIQSGQWIRISIRNPDPDSGGQKLPTKVEKIKKFHVLKSWQSRHYLHRSVLVLYFILFLVNVPWICIFLCSSGSGSGSASKW